MGVRGWGYMLKRSVCCAAILVALMGPAWAGSDDFDRVVSFGDRLSDNGNLDAATFGIAPVSDYFAGRFSNGPTFAELLAGNADFASGASSQQEFWGPLFLFNPAPVDGNVNLAIGGATTEGGIIPSVEVQIQAFQAAGG